MQREQQLALRVVVPDPPVRGTGVQVRPLVDGEDVLAAVFTDGPGKDPKYLLFPDGPLTAGPEPHDVRLAEALCYEECCGAVYVTIRRDGDQVVWTGWRNPRRSKVGLPEFRFDARQYCAEVERAVADTSWEWPARTVARLLEEHLNRSADGLARWACELEYTFAPVWAPEQVGLILLHPGRTAMFAGRAWLQFRVELPVGDGDPAEQARRLAAQLLADDPRRTAEVCGGSPAFAAELGYPWP